jgi:hypothetical protein
VDATVLGGALNRFDGARTTVALGAAAGSTTVPAADLDIDNDGDNDFAVGSGVIISDGTSSHCARITAITNAGLTRTISFTPNTAAAFAIATGAGIVAPAIVYEVTAAGLQRNNLLFSAQVEDIQVEFGVDIDLDGELTGGEFPVHSLAADTDRVRTVRLSVVTQTTRDDLGFINGGLPAIANRNAGATDTMRRRIAVNTVAPRNFL